MQENTEIPAAKKSRYGRPQLLKSERRDFKFKIGFNLCEYKKITNRAESAGLSEVELIRQTSLNQQIAAVPQVNKIAYGELAKLASNIKQIRFIAAETGQMPTSELLLEVEQKVQQLRTELLGSAA